MTTDDQTTQELLPYVKPTVERIPLSDARAGGTAPLKAPNDLVTSSS